MKVVNKIRLAFQEMDKKKVLTNMLVIMMAFTMFAVWYNKSINETAETSAKPSGGFKVYLITQDKTSEFYHILNDGASDMAFLLGINYVWTAPEQKNNQQQIEFLNQAVQNGANLILLAANDPVAISSAIEAAKAGGVKIIYVDSPANEKAITTLATDNYSAGATAGRNMIDELESEGIQSGSIGVMSPNETISSTSERDRGFRDIISADGRFQLLDTKYDNGDKDAALKIANEIIDENKNLVGIFATDEASTTALGNVIKDKKSKIVGIGFDRTAEIVNMLRNGYLKAVVIQNPYTMGYLGMAEAYAALKGFNTGPEFLNTGVNVLTQR